MSHAIVKPGIEWPTLEGSNNRADRVRFGLSAGVLALHHNLAALHYEEDALEKRNVRGRVTIDRDDVGEAAGFD